MGNEASNLPARGRASTSDTRAEHMDVRVLPGVMLMGTWCRTWYRDALDDKQVRVMISSSFSAHRVVRGLAECKQMRGRLVLPTWNLCLWEAEAGVPQFTVRDPSAHKGRNGCRKGHSPAAALGSFHCPPCVPAGAEAAGRWEQQQEEPSSEQASHQHGTQSLMGRK